MTKLYIGNLSFNTGDEELRDFFPPLGSPPPAVVIMDRDDPGRSRGFGFVTYATAEEAATAVAGADGQDLQVRALRGDMGGGRGGPGGGPAAADQTLECRDCSAEFIFSGRDQRYYASQGFSNPIRCTECKIKVKEAKSKPRRRSSLSRPASRSSTPPRGSRTPRAARSARPRRASAAAAAAPRPTPSRPSPSRRS
ncbi:hypothetical protein T484DRAFT_1974342, partial [Baffinella frigidus]